ncbi:unnamed protein product, partial [Mesorhabditis spiculigera]
MEQHSSTGTPSENSAKITRPRRWILILLTVCCFVLAGDAGGILLHKLFCSNERSGCFCQPSPRNVRCCCVGRDVSELSANMSTRVKTLIIYNTSITTIDGSIFDRYRNLEEIDISHLDHLTSFNASAVRNLGNLRKLAINYCPKLDEIHGTLLKDNLKMQTLIIRNTGLKTMPQLQMTYRNKMEVEVDLSHNHLQFIGKERIRDLRASLLRLDYNKLLGIETAAFQGSAIIALDLSHTALRELPTVGLRNVEQVQLRNVENLKKLPPIFSFRKLQKAVFTYPHHCCLFKHVDFKENLQEAREIKKRICKDFAKARKSATPKEKTTLSSTTAPPGNGSKNADFFEMAMALFEADLEVEEEPDYDLPPFEPDELGFAGCLEEESLEVVREFYSSIECTPEPDALNPCENIVGYPLLRRAIWVVWIAAIVGNALVWCAF